MALMPGFNTRSAAEVAHQYATEQLQQQENNLRAQAAQQQQAQFAQDQFMQQQRLSLAQMAQEQEGQRVDREFAFKGAEQSSELGIKYDPATRGYRPLAAGDPEFQRWQERKAEKDAAAKMRLEETRAGTIAGKVELAEKLQPFTVAAEERAVARQVAGEVRQRETALDAEKRAVAEADRRFKQSQQAHDDERWMSFQYQSSLARINHALKLEELSEVAKTKGEKAEKTDEFKQVSEARKGMNEAFNQWQEAERTYTAEFDRILNNMLARTKEAPPELSKPGFWWRSKPLTREEIINHPSFARAMAPFGAQRQQAIRMAAEAQAQYYRTSKLPVPPQVQVALQGAQPAGERPGAAPTVKETVGLGEKVGGIIAGLPGAWVGRQLAGEPVKLPGPENAPAGQRPPPAQRGGSMPSALPGETQAGKPYSKLDAFMHSLPPESQKANAEAFGAMYALAFDNPSQARTGISTNPVWEKAWESLDDFNKNAWARFLADTGAAEAIRREQGNAR